MFRKHLKPLCLVGLIDLCVLTAPAWAQNASVQQLVNQGNYWHDQGREDLAADTWRKLLATDANQPDALLGLGLIDLNQGRRAEAQKRLQLLQARHPQAPQTARLRLALGGGGGGTDNPLQAARRSAAAGRYVEAVRSYEQAFAGSAPPDDLALEYYQVLAGTPEGWSRARDGLQKLVARNATPAARLALAQVLTYREPSRREGISQLSALSQRQDTGGPARTAWRQALLWLNASQADAPLYQAFLGAQPNDREVAAKAAQLREQASTAAAAVDPNQRLLGEGFRALDNNQLEQAENRFAQVLRARPRDAGALGGLGSVRLRQERFEEANELLKQAVARDGKWRSAADSARYWLTLQQVRGQAGADAAARVQQAIALQPKQPAGYVALAQLQESGDPAAAERSYRKALELDAGNAGALQGLVGLLGRQGRAEEAAVMMERMTPAQQEKAGGRAALRANLARARAQEAIASGSLQMAQVELEDALLAQPSDPWLRLELARLYQRMGQPAEADRVMGELANAGDNASVEALQAQALFAQERQQWPQVLALLDRIPANARTGSIEAMRTVALVQAQGAQARGLAQRQRVGEAQLLLARTEAALGNPAQNPEAVAALAGAYADIGSSERAMTLARSLLQGDTPSVESRLQYASVLLRAGRDGEVAAVLRQLAQAPLDSAQQARLQDLRAGYVLRQVDALREQGNLEAAYSVLAPALAEHPDDPRNIAALARLYSAAGDHGQALALYQQQLQRSPGDVDALIAAAGSAASLRDMDTAETYLQQALAKAPDSPDVLAGAGRVYRAAGKNRRAESYFKASLAAAARQSGYADAGLPRSRNAALAGGAGTFNPFAGMNRGVASRALRGSDAPLPPAVEALASGGGYSASAAPLPGTPQAPLFDASGLPEPAASHAPALVDTLPVPGQSARSRRPAPAAAAPASQGVLAELRDLKAENSSSIAVGASYRSRDGQPGQGKLDDLQVPLEARFAVGDGKLIVAVTPAVLDAGRPAESYADASRFGGGPQAALAGALAADRTPVDSLVGSSLYQTLLTRGESNATRNLIEQRALDNGRYQELYNQTDGSLTAAERRAAALAALFADPLPSYLLSRDVANTPISQIANQLLNNGSLSRGLTAGEQAQLKALASGASGGQTPITFQDTLYAMVANAAGARRLSAQDATGAGISVGYQRGGLRADIGTSPLGFSENQIVGGIGYEGRTGDMFTWSGEASRRAVTDSVLSFSGVQDERTGQRWGGVTATGAKIGGTLDNGLLGGYASLSWHRLQGQNVANNERREAGLGVYVHALDTGNQALTAGLNITALQYERNLSGFTYGHGGYFSPQRYLDVGFPVHWNGRSERARLAWQVDGSIGVQHFEEKASDYFPTDPALQQAAYDAASMAALLGLSSTYIAPVYAGQTKTGVSYNLSAAAEWQLSSQLFLGGRMELNNARDYRQFGTSLYLRFLLDRLGSGLGLRPQVLRSPYAGGE
ncbi:cellulose biosynthesis protein BcsC [Stenotrophomonas sp. 24(2023)]|uniref:cellulose biosynthesis protein BcsC n=1 Tax=Stenotrophomonas sp. 24(2023) TaxID=3068324 RepID=UPI0027E0757F|nr:cellulose biosynthesis protein BcsC [Stenotrophomonas sp. 24(2023)]WMJ67795.1 cellulose synthase subunit BcsC-related outer membrane protein [Stenotrophomonas sp. 24(2023)]